MYLNIIFLPLLSFLTVSFFGSYFGKKGSVLITSISMFFCVCFSLLSFFEVGLNQAVCYIETYPWVISDLFEIQWGFMFDSLTCSMLVLVTVVSFLVHIFSSEYMSGDPHLSRFMSYLSLFTFFMIILVSGDNFIQLFIGWEGVGLCSYLLISFWSTRLQANKSAMKAMIVNRVGDYGLCLGLFLIYSLTGTLEFTSLFASITYWIGDTFQFFSLTANIFTAICLFLCLGVIGKSAQLGLHTWLPDAMEGPTPVSALIHAATMVTAGVFLILRCSAIFELTSTGLLVITFIGAMTAFFAATVGVFQNDLKKVIAYSTCSQLGYMVFACGISMYSVSFYHLFNHGFFKALLFLSAGSIIHAVQDEQDMRKMGGLLQVLPFSYSMILIGSLSLMGVPFLTGFYSKDFILESSYASYMISGHFAFWLGSISAALTSFYSIRLVYLTFYAKPNGYRVVYSHLHDAPIAMAFPLMVLAIASIFLGYLGKDLFVGPGTFFWGNSFFMLPQSLDSMDVEFIPSFIKLIPVIFSLGGASFSFILYSFFSNVVWSFIRSNFGLTVYNFFNQKWWFDTVYQHLIALKILSFGGNTTFKIMDKGFIELLGPYGIIRTIRRLSKQTSSLQTGWIHHSVFLMLLGIVLYIGFLSFGLSLLDFMDLKYFLFYIVVFLFFILG